MKFLNFKANEEYFIMTQNFRLENVGLINRDKKLSFKFNGKTYYGYEGDTLSISINSKWSSFSW
jgi:hypothetical protein